MSKDIWTKESSAHLWLVGHSPVVGNWTYVWACKVLARCIWCQYRLREFLLLNVRLDEGWMHRKLRKVHTSRDTTCHKRKGKESSINMHTLFPKVNWVFVIVWTGWRVLARVAAYTNRCTLMHSATCVPAFQLLHVCKLDYSDSSKRKK